MKHTRLIGVDISDASLKVLQLSNEGAIVAYGNSSLPSGVVEKGRVINKEAFSDALNTLLRETRPNILQDGNSIIRTVLCLPESKLFTHSLVIPETTKKDAIEAYVEEEARKIIPYELERMYWDYHTTNRQGKLYATFVGVAKADLDNFVEAFSFAQAQPEFISGELFALGHALLEDGFKGNTIIVDMGEHTTTIGLFAGDVMPDMSVVVPYAGDAFTKAIAARFELSQEEAEKQKRMYGLSPAHADTGVPEELGKCVAKIAEEINAMASFFKQKNTVPVERIILSGGSALLPGITEFVGQETGIAVSLADPLAKVVGHEVLEQGTPGILFANVIGLAHYAQRKKRSDINLLRTYRYEEGVTKKELPRIQDIRAANDLYYYLYTLIQEAAEYANRYTDFFKKKLSMPLQLTMSLLFLAATLVFLAWVILKYM